MSPPENTPKFVWPPAKQPTGKLRSDPPPPLTTRLPEPRWLRVLEATEEAFIGVRSRSFRRLAATRGWEPAEARAHCWRCGSPVGQHEADGDGCASCRDKSLPWSRFIGLGAYEGVLRSAIGDLKFHGWRSIGVELGTQLGERLASELARLQIDPARAALVPIPTSWRSRMARGVDHTQVLGKAAAASSGVHLVRALRRRHGPSQTAVPASARAGNVRGKFHRLRATSVLQEAEIVILLDDIRTTGATLREACRTLRSVQRSSQQGVLDAERVWASSVAVTRDPSRSAASASGVSTAFGGMPGIGQ